MGQLFALPFNSLNGMTAVSAHEAREIIDSGARVIDVRTSVEYETGHIPDSSHIPLADIQREAATFDRETPVILCCRSGNRSGPAAEAFVASGWEAHSIDGGLLAWEEAGFELEPDGGS